MSDFDMVIRGSLVSADSILEDGWLGIMDGRIAAMGSHSPLAARDQVDAREGYGCCRALSIAVPI